MTGTMDEVKEQVHENMKAEEYHDPTQTLPDPPPEFKGCDCEKCESCEIQLIGGKFSRILSMTWFCGQMFINVVLQS